MIILLLFERIIPIRIGYIFEDIEMIKILVVEDERAISDLIRLNLTKTGYSCTALYDGKSAADILETHTFDLILLDIMLPEINGYELMEYIRPM